MYGILYQRSRGSYYCHAVHERESGVRPSTLVDDPSCARALSPPLVRALSHTLSLSGR